MLIFMKIRYLYYLKIIYVRKYPNALEKHTKIWWYDMTQSNLKYMQIIKDQYTAWVDCTSMKPTLLNTDSSQT